MRAPRLLLELGRGGMGVVFLAIERTVDDERLVVVKQLKPELAADPEFRTMLLEEARIVSRLSHPNVVRTFETGFDGAHHFIRMEWLEGQPFDALVRDEAHALPLRLAVYVLCQALRGLHAAHELEVVHRDVSPHNVFVTYDGAVKVLDFGIAKAADSIARTRTGIVKGKATYMAPEQASRAKVDRRADVFAVGVMLWELLAHRRFWGERPDQAIFEALRRGGFESPRAYANDVPDALHDACMRAIAAKPDGRFETAEAMRQTLVSWLGANGGEPTSEELAAFVSGAFADERARTAREIELAREGAPTASVEPAVVPARGFSVTHALPPEPTKNATRPRWLVPEAGIATIVVLGAAVYIRAQSTPVTTPAIVPSGCATSSECRTKLGGAAVCRARDRACAPLVADGCRALASDAALDDVRTLWIGTMLPAAGTQAADLARREIEGVAHGVPMSGGAARPIGIVACDGKSDRAAAHLRDTVDAVIRGDDASAIVKVEPSAPLTIETGPAGAPSAPSPAAARFVLRYNESFEPHVTARNAPAAPYDAVYAIVYAAHAAGDGPLARAFARLSSGDKVFDIGASSLFDVVRALDEGHDVRLGGASGRLPMNGADDAHR